MRVSERVLSRCYRWDMGARLEAERREEGAAAPHSDTVPQERGARRELRWMWETAQRQDRGAWVEQGTRRGGGQRKTPWFLAQTRLREEELPYAEMRNLDWQDLSDHWAGHLLWTSVPSEGVGLGSTLLAGQNHCGAFQVHLSSGLHPVMLISVTCATYASVWLKCSWVFQWAAKADSHYPRRSLRSPPTVNLCSSISVPHCLSAAAILGCEFYRCSHS